MQYFWNIFGSKPIRNRLKTDQKSLRTLTVMKKQPFHPNLPRFTLKNLISQGFSFISFQLSFMIPLKVV